MADEPQPGPDRQAVGTYLGAATGAGAGAITGAQLTAATGPGIAIGAGFGALFGGLSGLGQDMLEEDQLRRFEEQHELRQRLWAQEILAEHYARRLALHPSRDIFPADVFFEADSSSLRPESAVLIREIARYTKTRVPWSRIVIAAYSTANTLESTYAQHITDRRAKEIATQFIRAGIEPRRLLTQSVTLSEPIVVDPNDSYGRYRQAIEIVALDY